MAAPSLAPALDSASRRLVPRYPISIPLDVVVLRSGVPNTIPGRCVDLSETGIGAIVAGELAPSQAVAVELRLPNVGLPVRARAQVRFQNRLRCGLQFVGLSSEQREKIRYWTSQTAGQSVFSEEIEIPQTVEERRTVVRDKNTIARSVRVRRRRFFVLLGFLLAFTVIGWWQWQTAWNKLESEGSGSGLLGVPVRVPAQLMDKRILYKTDAVYPEEARRAGTEGVVVLDALIARDGTVRRLRPISGPELLTQSASNAVLEWRFEPYRAGREAVEIETTITLEFRLH